jgi:hypothetical protein
VGSPEQGLAPVVAAVVAGRRMRGIGLLGVVVAVAACSAPVTPGPNLTPVPTTAAASPASPVDPTPAGPSDEVRVTLGIYSGRPDPTWTLTGAEAAAVERAIEALPETAGTPPEGGLGYHGFTITSLGRTLTAYLGVVSTGGGPGVVRTDPGRTVERLLLELGRARLAPAEVAEVERSLAAP